jgi:uncharacterized protein YpmS
MNLPFNGFKDFWRWLWAVIIMIPIIILVVVVGVIFYLTVREPKESGGACGGYCDHFDDLL